MATNILFSLVENVISLTHCQFSRSDNYASQLSIHLNYNLQETSILAIHGHHKTTNLQSGDIQEIAS